MLYTTLNLLKEHKACASRYEHLLNALGGVSFDHDEPIHLTRVLDLNGFDDALWALRAVPKEQEAERDKLARLFAVWCCRNTPLGDGRTVWDLMTDESSRNAVEVAKRYADGEATSDELDAARAAAWDAARDAAGDAAWDAAWAAAWAAARDAARDAAWAAAWDVARAAARAAARDAARDAQAAQFRKMLEEGV